MRYEKLTTEQQAQMLEQRLAQYEQEHFQFATNADLLANSTNPADVAEVERAHAAMKVLDDGYAAIAAKLAKIPKPKAPK